MLSAIAGRRESTHVRRYLPVARGRRSSCIPCGEPPRATQVYSGNPMNVGIF
jgi:hypothetical protein